MENCIFCKIANKEIPANIVYEDEEVLAFLDIAPINLGHTLVIPKKHFVNIHDTPEDMFAKLAKVVKLVAKAVKSSMNPDGINIGMNNESAAGQIVFHTHIHVMPRLTNDGFESWHNKKLYTEGEADEVAKKIIAELARP